MEEGSPEMGLEERGQALPVVGQEKDGSAGWFTTKLDFAVNWARRNSLWPMPFGTACCAIEMMASYASRFDVARFGMERMSFSPRQADLLICAGRLPYKMAPVIRRIWDQMPQPKWAISMGACASTGGVFDVYSMVQGIDTIIPVDVYVPGCPPRPEGLIYGILMLQEKIKGETLTNEALRAEVKSLIRTIGARTFYNRDGEWVESTRKLVKFACIDTQRRAAAISNHERSLDQARRKRPATGNGKRHIGRRETKK